MPLFDRRGHCPIQVRRMKRTKIFRCVSRTLPAGSFNRWAVPTLLSCPSRNDAAEEVLADYRTSGLSLSAHPLQFLRQGLDGLGVVPASRLKTWPNGKPVRVAGIVLVRQRPSTAKGITFVTLEDETGTANLIIRPDVWQKFRQAALRATVLLAHGRLQREGLVIHVLVTRLENLSGRLESRTAIEGLLLNFLRSPAGHWLILRAFSLATADQRGSLTSALRQLTVIAVIVRARNRRRVSRQSLRLHTVDKQKRAQ